ncbi:IPT/TIG domain-containing protein [Nocardioides sp. MH1]|uniref:IPT/TIG domain-containing protein n=1 Tax=Nocardioides sp. MH1 TaxID=3242490 RepID=UPI0035207EFE
MPVALGLTAPEAAWADSGPSLVASVQVGDNGALGVGVDSSTHTIYASTQFADTLSVIDGATNTVTATIPVGSRPGAVDVDPTSHTVYVANNRGPSVSVIDGTTNTVTATIPLAQSPQGLTVDPTTHTVYVASPDDGTLVVIDGDTNTVEATVPVGLGSTPVAAAVDPSTETVYVANIASNSVSVVDAATNTLTSTIAVGSGPLGIDVDSTTHTVFVSNAFDNTLSVINGASGVVTATVPTGVASAGVAVDPTNHQVYVGIQDDSTLLVLDGMSDTVVSTVSLEGSPFAVALDATTHTVYTGNSNGSVSVVAYPPAITSISPSSGPITGGTEVTITGTGFSAATAVDFGSGHVTDFTIDSDTQITATAPPSTSIRDRHIWVTTPNGVSEATSSDLFTYTGTAPAISRISPATGPLTGSTEVTITGTGFTDTTAVTFGTAGPAQDVHIDSDTQLTVTAPDASTAGVRNVRVTTSTGGTSPVVTAARYTYTAAAPTITDVTPATGPIEGGTIVIITGTDFTDATRVVFGSAGRALFHVDSPTQITATSPQSNLAGIRNIRVRSASGTSPTVKADRFTYTAED